MIPNDDFIFDNQSSSFTSVETELPHDFGEVQNTDNIIPEIDFEDFLNPSDTTTTIADTDIEAEFTTSEEVFEEHVSVPNYVHVDPEVKTEKPPKSQPSMQQSSSALEDSIKILESKLGLEITTLQQDERDRLMNELGDIINATFDSLKNSLEIKDKVKEDLNLASTHIDTNNSNPLKLGSSAIKLLQNQQGSSMLGMMNILEAIKKSFNEIDMHAISLHNSSKSVMNIALAKFSPKNLEYKFEANGMLRGVMPKQQLLWRAYVDMFKGLNENPEEGVKMVKDDLKKEYEKISYSLKLQTHETRQGL